MSRLLPVLVLVSLGANVALGAAWLRRTTKGRPPSAADATEEVDRTDRRTEREAPAASGGAGPLRACVDEVMRKRDELRQARQKLKPLLRTDELFEMAQPNTSLTAQVTEVLQSTSAQRLEVRDIHGECRDRVCRLLIVRPRSDTNDDAFINGLRETLRARLGVQGLAFGPSRPADVVGEKGRFVEEQVYAVIPEGSVSGSQQ